MGDTIWQELNDNDYNGPFLGNSATSCYVKVEFGNGVRVEQMFLPVYPLEVTNSITTNYASSSIIGRTGQISAYNSTNDITTSFSLHLHRELRVYGEGGGDDKIDDIISLIESAQYPLYNENSNSSYAPIVTYKFGDTLICGKQTSNNTRWSGPKIDGKYMEATLNISVTNLPTKVIDFNDIFGSNPRGTGRW